MSRWGERESTLSIVERALLIKDVDIFQGLSSEQVARIAARTTEQRHDAGELMPNPERGFYFVIEGRIEFLVEGKVVRELGPGGTFGLTAFLDSDGEEDSDVHQVRAGEACHVLYLPKEDFFETMIDNPEVAVALAKRLAGLVVTLLARVEQLENRLAGPDKGV